MSNALSQLLVQRAALTHEIRAFFDERAVLEVTTPLLSRAAVTDPAIESFRVVCDETNERYLRTSPEFPMKRLLSAGAPDMYELGPVFRNGECGRWHNPEFTLLEWYRRGFGMQQLICEVVELLRSVGNGRFAAFEVRQMRYYAAFDEALGHSLRDAGAAELATAASRLGTAPQGDMDRDQWLDYLFSTHVQPGFGEDTITVVTHYPASQAALARLDPEAPDTALRFEVFVNTVELANGFEELDNAHEQARRFESDNELRTRRAQRPMPLDRAFLESLDKLPACSGVALGFERLLMLTEGLDSIEDALPVGWAHA